MLLNLAPLKSRDYRYLFFSQFISFLGSMITYVAIPYQVYELTKSSWLVGLLGIVQLVPTLIFGLIGGSVADAMDRRKLLLISESIMCVCTLGFMFNSMLGEPNVVVIFVLTGIVQTAVGFHRPSLDALTQKLLDPKQYAAAGALGSFRHCFGAIVGPALGGVLISGFGAKIAYFVDFLTFLIALILIALMRRVPNPTPKERAMGSRIIEGLKYAFSRPELIGTYVVDIVAMAFAFPVALFPAMAESWGGAKAAGYLYSAMSVGSLIVTLLSGWTSKVRRHGAMVVWAAAIWGVAIIGLGFSDQLWLALLFLAAAGAADMVSGLFRSIIWNETIPNDMRGRLSGVEMISYMSGPLIGNARAGAMAGAFGIGFSIWSGGLICTVGVILCGFLLPKFWKYRSKNEVSLST